MLLGLIFVAVAILLGILNADAFVSAKHPKLKELIDKTTPFENYLGLAGIIFGLFMVFGNIDHYIGFYSFLGLILGLLTIALGVLSASGFLKENIFKDSLSMQAKVDKFSATLGAYEQNLGLGAIVLAVIYLLMLLGV